MRPFIKILMMTYLYFSAGLTIAANEWKNPDLAEPETTAKPAPAPAQKTLPAKVSKQLAGDLALDVVRVCALRESYNDKGSGGRQDGSFSTPSAPPGYYIIGGYAQGNYSPPTDCVLAVKPANAQSISLIRVPDNWQLLWTDKNSGARMDGSIWHPLSSDPDYVCLGSIANKGYKKPLVTNYACLHHCLVETIPVNHHIWSSKGTGSSMDVSVYKLHNSNSFYAVPTHDKPGRMQDLKANTNCRF